MSEPPPPYDELDARIMDVDGESEVDPLEEEERAVLALPKMWIPNGRLRQAPAAPALSRSWFLAPASVRALLPPTLSGKAGGSKKRPCPRDEGNDMVVYCEICHPTLHAAVGHIENRKYVVRHMAFSEKP